MKYDNIDIEEYNKTVTDENKKLRLCHCGKKYISWNFNQHTKTKHHINYKMTNKECYFYDNIQYKMFDYISVCKTPECEYFGRKNQCLPEHYMSHIHEIILEDNSNNTVTTFKK